MRGNKRVQIIAISVVSFLAVCLVGFLVYSIFTGGSPPSDAAPTTVAENPEEGKTEGENGSTEETDGNETEPTPTATQVVGGTEDEGSGNDSGDATETTEPESKPVDVATPVPTTVATTVASDFSNTPVETIVSYEMEQLLRNPDFEAGFDEKGVALEWNAFQSSDVTALYSPESAPYISSGTQAQRMTLINALQQDRYAGIYQQVEVVPEHAYTLTLHGQIRSEIGDITKSSYGYRMQYALDESGGSWQDVNSNDWVELPWDETVLYGPENRLMTYTIQITPSSEKLTLFVRAWNKWATGGEVQYSVDNFSLTGVKEIIKKVAMAPVTDGNEAADFDADANPPGGENANDLLPVTGMITPQNLANDGRIWGGLLVLFLLGTGVTYRMYRYR
jgi:hypothetical protein